ncbi:hypothetical protein ABZX65_07280 [Streptomyces sp. NPDC003300]|uniref:hypothetical protein n=1 Tax=unclassified Streptomyces TaxID=2593676 RepID=UPI0033BB4C00
MEHRAEPGSGFVTDTLCAEGWITTPEVEAVMRAVSRHAFTPEVSVRKAYEPYAAVPTARSPRWTSIPS